MCANNGKNRESLCSEYVNQEPGKQVHLMRRKTAVAVEVALLTVAALHLHSLWIIMASQ